MASPAAILVVGAFGAFGRALVHDLLRRSPCRVLAGGRGRTRMAELQDGLEPSERDRLVPALCDLRDLRSVDSALTGVSAAVCAAGPYQSLPMNLLEACLHREIPYLDLADDRGFVRRARALVSARPPGSAAGVGWSSAPALSGLLARLAAEDLETIEEIQIQIAPGGRGARGAATVASLLDSLSKPMRIWDDGRWRKTLGWSEPRLFRFPPPVGTREGYLVDVADHELFPPLFNARRVQFRAGAESSWQNRAASLLAWLSKELAFDWTAMAPAFSLGLKTLGCLGTAAGALGVEVSGKRQGSPIRRRACIVAERAGEIIPALAAAILAPKLAADPRAFEGLIPLDGWLGRRELEEECRERGLIFSMEEVPA